MATASVPTLELEDPAGRRVVVAPRSCEDRVGDLADALGVDPRQPLDLDGRSVARQESLARAGILRGSRLRTAGPTPDAPAGDPLVLAVCDAGPDAGTTVPLGAGRHVVGRSPLAAVRLDDPHVEAHHALLDVDADGSVTVVQLTGRVPCRVGGEPVASRAIVSDRGLVTLGASRIRVAQHVRTVSAGAVVGAVHGDPWRRALRRTPRVVPRWDPDPIAVPAGPGPSLRPGVAGLVAAVLTAFGAAVVAVLVGSPMFLVFAGVGVLASVGMWVVSRVGAARDGRRRHALRDRDAAEFAAAVAAQRAARWQHHVATTPGVAEAVVAATMRRADVWSRRAAHDDAHRASIGWGAVEWEVALDRDGPDPLAPELATVVSTAGRFDDAAVPVDLGPGAALAISGPGADAVVRALVVQLATWTGPADLQLIVVAGEPAAWDWCGWLPHATAADGPRVVAADDSERVSAALGALTDGTGRHVVVVTDRADALTQRTGAVRRFVAGAPSVAIIVLVGPDGSPPAMCRSVLEIGSIGSARWWADASVDAHSVALHATGVTVASATAVARSLAGLHDPEDPSTSGIALATAVGIGVLTERHGPGPIDDPIAIAAAWRGAGPDPPPVATLGVTADGVVDVDLARDGPHALVAGTTGSGKSELLRTLVVSLATRCSPDHVTFVLVDYKGGSTFDACADLPHTVGLVTDLDDQLAERALTSLDAEVRRREQLLRAFGAVDLADHRARGGGPLPRLVVVIDEFATLAAELPDFIGALVGIAQRGRSLGVHLVLATQRPAGVVSDDIRANTNLRVALRLHDAADARDVVGDDGPASFPRGAPGRAMLRLGADEHVVFQAARSTGPADLDHDDRLHVVGDLAPGDRDVTELAVLVRSIRNAAALSDTDAPHRPWLPPLPTRLGPADLLAVAPAAGAIGLLDDPPGQCRRPLCWTPADGNLAIVGAVGSGTTTALRSVVVAACASRPATGLHVYVVDARGDERLDELGRLTHCGGVVRPHERERLSRMLRRLTTDLDARRLGVDRPDRPDIVLAIDGLPALRTVLDDPLDHGDLDRLGRVVAEGAASGLATVFTADRPGGVPAAMLAACSERWVGRLDDAAEASACGIPGAIVPTGGAGRFVVATSRLVGQIADLAVPEPAGCGAGPAPIGVLPERTSGPTGGVAIGGELELTVGLEFDSLTAAVLRVTDGEHVLVAGPARSGRTTAAVALAASWRAAHPGGTVRVVSPRGLGPWPGEEVGDLDDALGAIGALDDGAPALIVVDDAERVDDPRLGALAAERRPGLLLVAAGRPDALRTSYGHWTTIVRRSRLGILLAACADIDGDLLGELLPRRPPIAARPGLAWIVDATGRRLAQLPSQR